MTDIEERFHKKWIGLVQPSEGLVVSEPVLTEAEVMVRHGAELRERYAEICDASGGFELRRAAEALLELPRERIDDAPAASVYLPEGQETVRPTFAVTDRDGEPMILAWEIPGVDLDKADSRAGAWAYPPLAKFERLLRAAAVPIGWLSNRGELRLVYAPDRASLGWIAFRKDALGSSGGEVLDALVMLCGRARLFGSAADRTLLALLRASRERQANVTTALAEQVFDALGALLRGFEDAAARDGSPLVRQAQEDGTLYTALLTVLLRLVFVLYAEQRSLLPVDDLFYEKQLGLLSLYARLRDDAALHPDTMGERFSAWPRLLALFRAVYFGARHADLVLPPRRGELFDPAEHPLLEGWGPAGGAPVAEADRSALRVPTIDDGTVLGVLDKLLVLDGQRLSYSALDVEQIGSVYERLMGYSAVRVESPAVCLRDPSRRTAGTWMSAKQVLSLPPKKRAAHLEEYAGKLGKAAAAIEAAADEASMLAALLALKKGGTEPVAARLVLQPGSERRRTSSHYTPRLLTEPIVEKTLRPLLKTMGEDPSSERLLSLTICDPAMGSGAFLVAACRFLGKELERAWAREGRDYPDAEKRAQRVVAQRCLYGVDKNPLAVSLAKLSLWLTTLAKDEPFTFLDHSLRHGDSLVGLSLEQIAAFDWEVGGKRKAQQLDLFAREIETELKESVARRKEILAAAETATSTEDKERLAFYAKDGLDRVQLIGDLIVGAFFARDKDKDRRKELQRRKDLVARWLGSGEHVPEDFGAQRRSPSTGELEGRSPSIKEQLRAMQREIRARVPVLHWPVEFPEVFFAERADPLDGDARNEVAMMDAFVGNPPFAGKNVISTSNTEGYLDWLMAERPDVRGRPNTDLCAYFFRRCADLLGAHGTFGLVATKTIAEGDSRLVGLKPILEQGGAIYDATSSVPWSGDATVSVAVIHVALGSVVPALSEHKLDGVSVATIDSRLTATKERPEPVRLPGNANRAFLGGKLVGADLAVSLDEHARLVAADPRNAEVLRPYLGGEEANRNPRGSFERYMIDFSRMSLEEARQWPMLMQIVEEKVKPARDRDKRGTYKTYWWRPGESGGALYAALAGAPRCLVTSSVTKHLMLSFKPTDWFFANTLYVFAFDDYAHFAVLQSRVHEPWARLLSSSMRGDLRYSASDCFETFPFPPMLPTELEAAGRAFYEARAEYMVRENVGLTITYNRMKDPDDQTPAVVHLRELSEAMDRAVLAAYGWSDLRVPPFAERDLAFGDEVVDRLFGLNRHRSRKGPS